MRCLSVVFLLLPHAAMASATPSRPAITVKQADLYEVASSDGAVTRYRLAGVWAPVPPGVTGEKEHYMGGAARDFVNSLLSSAPPQISPMQSEDRGARSVRVTVGADGQDLAVLLTRVGLAMCDRPSAATKDQADQICEAERHARRHRLGMHDGGFQAFVNSQRQVVDLGLLLWWEGKRDRTPQSTLEDRHPGSARSRQPGSDWSSRAPMRSAIEAIRDYGASMGLPRDSSRSGI